MSSNNISLDDVKHLSKLSSLPLSKDRQKELISQIATTFEYVDTLQNTDTRQVPETNQVTGLTNIMREDQVDESRMLTQKQALSGSKNSYQGYFVVPAILE